MQPYLALITPLSGGHPDQGLPGGGGWSPTDPGFGNRPIHHPGHPDHGLPSSPGHPSQPIHHPGHPDHGLPSHGGGGTAGQLPWSPGSPDQSLPVPPGVTPPASPGGALKNKLVVLWHVPGQTEWHGKAFEPGHPDAGLPPTPEPKA